MDIEQVKSYEMEEKEPIDLRIRQLIQIVADVSGSLSNLSVLDLACLSGYFSLEFARHGAKVLGIEGRPQHVEAARLAKQQGGFDNVEFVLDDIRNLSKEKYGVFDVVLCCGVLYHLNVPDVFRFVQGIASVCSRFAVIETSISLVNEQSYLWNGKEYWGRCEQEHSDDATQEEKLKVAWASLDNPRSVWFTRSSLFNLLHHAGFTSVYECRIPLALYVYSGNRHRIWEDRVTLLAMKGQPQTVLTWPEANSFPEGDWPASV